MITETTAKDHPPQPSSRRRCGQWSLRTLLVAITFVAVGPGGWIVYQRQRMQREQAAIANLDQRGLEVYARPHWLWTLLAGREAGPVVGLAVRRVDASEARLAPLAELNDLVWLDVKDLEANDADFAALARLSKLERLRLDDTQATDAGLQHLKGLRRLKTLNVSETEVSDAGLEHLAGLSRLETLSLRKTRVTDTGVQKLQQALPKLQIER